jgi:hypothetical protein
MVGRREFLAKSVGAGVVLATASLTDASKAFAVTGPTGYGVGQTLPPIVGLDQYNARQRLANYRRSWVLVDLCPLWCTACNQSATQHAAFRQYIRSRGIPFRIFSVVVEDVERKASQRLNAEQWAESYGLCGDIVLHCNGDANSPLRNLVDQFAAANGNNSPGYPSYALVDPGGVVRYYQDFADLNQLQAQLSALTGIALTQTWTLESPPSHLATVATTMTIKGQFSDSSPMNETIELTDSIYPVQGTNIGVLSLSNPATATAGVSGFTNLIVADVAREFDPNTPIQLVFTQTSPPVAVPFTRVVNVGDTFAFAPDGAISGSGPFSVDTNQVVNADGVVERETNGVTFELESIAEAIASQASSDSPTGNTWSAIWFNETFSSPSPERWSMAYSLTETLMADVTASTIGAPSKVLARLEKILRSLQKRHFSSAAHQAQVAADELGKAAADFAIQTDAAWLTSHLTNLAS